MLKKRVNIFFEEKTWTKLKKHAKQQHRSASNLIREAVEEKFFLQTAARRSSAFDAVLKHRPKAVKRIDYKKLINEGRDAV